MGGGRRPVCMFWVWLYVCRAMGGSTTWLREFPAQAAAAAASVEVSRGGDEVEGEGGGDGGDEGNERACVRSNRMACPELCSWLAGRLCTGAHSALACRATGDGTAGLRMRAGSWLDACVEHPSTWYPSRLVWAAAAVEGRGEKVDVVEIATGRSFPAAG